MDSILASLIKSLIKREISNFKTGELQNVLDDRFSNLVERKPIKGIDGQDGKSFSIEEHGPAIREWIAENRLKFEDLTPENIEQLRGQMGRAGRDGRDGHDFVFAENADKISELLNFHLISISDSLRLKFSDLTNDELLQLKGRDGRDGKDFKFEDYEEYFSESILKAVDAIKNDFKITFSDLTDDQILALKGKDGRDGRDFKYENYRDEINSEIVKAVQDISEGLKLKFSDLTDEQKNEIRGPRGQRGKPGRNFNFDDHKEYFDSLKLKFSDLTEDEIAALTLTFDKLTAEQKSQLTLKFEDLTDEQRSMLRGPRGQRGKAGIGHDGDSAYAVAVKNGFVGTEVEWLASLRGPRGLTIVGPRGIEGKKGDTGIAIDGKDGRDGRDAPYVVDIRAQYHRDEISFKFIFSDGTEIITDRVPLPKAINHFHGIGGGGSSGGGASAQDTFETFSKNLKAYPAAYAYSGSKLSTITYTVPSGTVVKTLNYTGDVLTSIVLSGSVPSGIDLTKTLTYTGSNLTSVAYS